MTTCTRCGGTPSPACDSGPCQFAPVKGEAQPITSINEMCAILKKRLIFSDEYTDCAVLYNVTFDQLRDLYDLGRAAVDTGDALDAARYRHMRDRDNSLETRQRDKGIVNGPSCYHEIEGIWELKSGEGLDEAIDRARASLSGNPEGDGA